MEICGENVDNHVNLPVASPIWGESKIQKNGNMIYYSSH